MFYNTDHSQYEYINYSFPEEQRDSIKEVRPNSKMPKTPVAFQ